MSFIYYQSTANDLGVEWVSLQSFSMSFKRFNLNITISSRIVGRISVT